MPFYEQNPSYAYGLLIFPRCTKNQLASVQCSDFEIWSMRSVFLVSCPRRLTHDLNLIITSLAKKA